jgi:hypothetical protein
MRSARRPVRSDYRTDCLAERGTAGKGYAAPTTAPFFARDVLDIVKECQDNTKTRGIAMTHTGTIILL